MERERAKFKYSEEHLIPLDVYLGIRVVTSDGIECDVHLAGQYYTSMYDDRAEEHCQRIYGMSFKSVKVAWASRLNRCSLDYWCWIKLSKV